ncbi:MAG: isoprenyl transferase [Planctomycetota bacterium]
MPPPAPPRGSDDRAAREKSAGPSPAPVPPEALPRHIAIIMDGNGRWAQERGLPRRKGHAAGVETIREIVRAASEWKIHTLSLYAFSTENWKRPRAEIAALMLLLRNYLRKERDELHAENVRIRAIGDLDALPRPVRRELDKALDLTRENTGLTLVLALSYGARDEIVRAARKLAQRAVAGELAPESIDPALFSAALDTAGLPDPDLVIRTAGEMRLSNFLLWQSSYSEYYSTRVYWPDFNRGELVRAIRAYGRRIRTFGGLAGEA